MTDLYSADLYLYLIIALFPLTALMLVCQVNPYHALVIRGILGAVAVIVYAVLGAADVALTEALVGTMLAITLYAVAVRSSMVMRLGVLEEATIASDNNHLFGSLLEQFRTALSKYHLRLELVGYPNLQALQQALTEKEIHATCVQRSPIGEEFSAGGGTLYTSIRVRRLYDLLQSRCSGSETQFTYIDIPNSSLLELSVSESGKVQG